MRPQSLNVLPLKPGVDQYIAIHATLAAKDFSLLISTLPVHSPAFFSKISPDFSCVGCGSHMVSVLARRCRMQVPVLSAGGM